MKKLLLILLALTFCISACSCSFLLGSGTDSGETPAPSEPTVEDLYNQLVEYASNGQYLEAWRVGQLHREVLEYQDAQAYVDYCQAMRAYEAGAIGVAYRDLQKVSNILKAKAVIEQLEATLVALNGYYVEDNGQGSFLHLVIRDGFVASAVIGYNDAEQTFNYTDEDFYSSIIRSKYTNGTEYLAMGRYSSLGAEITVDYVITTFDDTDDIMLVAFEGNQYNTFNGVYEKIKEAK